VLVDLRVIVPSDVTLCVFSSDILWGSWHWIVSCGVLWCQSVCVFSSHILWGPWYCCCPLHLLHTITNHWRYCSYFIPMFMSICVVSSRHCCKSLFCKVLVSHLKSWVCIIKSLKVLEYGFVIYSVWNMRLSLLVLDSCTLHVKLLSSYRAYKGTSVIDFVCETIVLLTDNELSLQLISVRLLAS